VINGQKIFVGSANGTEWMWTICCTEPERRAAPDLSWFMINASLPVSPCSRMNLMGGGGEGASDMAIRTPSSSTMCAVPASCLVGGENNAGG